MAQRLSQSKRQFGPNIFKEVKVKLTVVATVN